MWWELGTPQRIKVVNSHKDIVEFVKIYNGVKNLYCSVYAFEQLDNGKPDYRTAHVDKMFFDFDPTENEDAKDFVVQFHEYLKKEKLKHYIRFSGRGWHVFVLTDVLIDNKIDKKMLLYKAQEILAKESGLMDKMDLHVFGDLARIVRIPNTINLKTGKYCRNIDVKKGWVETDKKVIMGSKYFSWDGLDVKDFDYRNEERMRDWDENVKEAVMNDELLSKLPPVVSYPLKRGWAGWHERFLIITYLKEKGWTKAEVEEVLKKYLTKERVHGGKLVTDYYHCVFEEKQLDKTFDKYDYYFPTTEWIKKRGLCPEGDKCTCGKDIYSTRRDRHVLQ